MGYWADNKDAVFDAIEHFEATNGSLDLLSGKTVATITDMLGLSSDMYGMVSIALHKEMDWARHPTSRKRRGGKIDTIVVLSHDGEWNGVVDWETHDGAAKACWARKQGKDPKAEKRKRRRRRRTEQEPKNDSYDTRIKQLEEKVRVLAAICDRHEKNLKFLIDKDYDDEGLLSIGGIEDDVGPPTEERVGKKTKGRGEQIDQEIIDLATDIEPELRAKHGEDNPIKASALAKLHGEHLVKHCAQVSVVYVDEFGWRRKVEGEAKGLYYPQPTSNPPLPF